MSKRYEREHQDIGRYKVFLRGDQCDVIMRAGNIERNLMAEEALLFLNWLNMHQGELYEIVRRNEQNSDDRQE